MRSLDVHQWDFLSGAGTGGTLMGVYEYLQSLPVVEQLQRKVVQVAPEELASEHGIQGINDGADFLLDRSKMHGCINVSTQDAIHAAQALAKTHGLLVGISSGANVVAARRYLVENPERNVVTLLCDRGERYFSIF